jgi:hypothetical protein
MPVMEGTIPSLLQGVSQQIPRERQPGQLGAQLNMLSDPVTSIRRRPPAYNVITTDLDYSGDDKLFTAYIERGNDGRHLLIDTVSGRWLLLAKVDGTIVSQGQWDYFKATLGAVSLQTASVGGLTYILNTEQRPNTVVDNAGKKDPSITGFMVITSTSFGKTWDITVASPALAGGKVTGKFVTWDASEPGNAAWVGATYVLEALAFGKPANTSPSPIESIGTAITAAGGTVTVTDNVMYISGLPNCVVTTASGTTYASASNQSRVLEESNLPAALPSSANGTMCAVGQAGADTTWYRFDYPSRSWKESGAYGSITKITNMPLELAADDDIIPRDFEGRLSGDDETNEDPYFVVNGFITGISAFQGRLVLLSGAGVSMSASGLYQRFYRSTVTSLLDTDRIDIASASAQDSTFRTAMQFNRDLVIFGDSMQAVIPGTGLITPGNASVSLTSEVSCDSRIRPMLTGQTLLYPNRRNSEYAGLLEFIPSSYTASQYVTQDATVHLPKYIPGRVMEMHVSSVTNIGFVRYSGNRNALLVYEFMWGADAAKAQAAYHTWEFQQEILSLHALSESMVIFVKSSAGKVQMLRLDPREGFVAGAPYDVPYIDNPLPVYVQNRVFQLPAALRYTGITKEDIAAAFPANGMAGSEVGIESVDSNWNVTCVRGVKDGLYHVGLRYTSSMTLTPPMLKDQNDNIVGSNSVRLLRLDTAVRNTGDFLIKVVNTSRDVNENFEDAVVLLNSKELALGRSIKSDVSNLIIPCRTVASTTDVSFTTNGTLELNVLDVSYMLKHNQRFTRI